MKKKEIYVLENTKHTWQTINRGKPIYYKNIEHWIVYEFDDKMIISKTKDLIKGFSKNKTNLSVKPQK